MVGSGLLLWWLLLLLLQQARFVASGKAGNDRGRVLRCSVCWCCFRCCRIVWRTKTPPIQSVLADNPISVTWIASAVLVILYINKGRGGNTASEPSVAPAASSVAPTQDIPLDQKYDYQVQQQQQQSSYPQTPQQYPQQPYVDQQQQHAGFNANPYPQYHQDPIHRGDTVSPVSSVGYGHNPHAPSGNASELSGMPYTPNLPELSQHK